MRRYDDPVEVRRGMVPGPGGDQEGPAQFLWRGRLWKVCDVVAHWVETGPWWQSAGVHAVLGADGAEGADRPHRNGGADGAEGAEGAASGRGVPRTDLLAEREVWRVEAARGRPRPAAAAGAAGAAEAGWAGAGLFDLVHDGADGSWQLVRCED